MSTSAACPRPSTHFSQLVQFYPGAAASASSISANAFTAAGKTQEAIDLLNHALELPDATADERARAFESLGTVYGRQGRLDQAEAFFQQALKLNPESFTINYYLGLTYFNENKLDLARSPLQRAAAINPEDVRSRVFLARLEFRDGSPDKASALAREILTLDPANADALAILYPGVPFTPGPVNRPVGRDTNRKSIAKTASP